MCFNLPQVIGLSSHPQQSSKWAQLPHRASAMSSVADHLLQDLLPTTRCVARHEANSVNYLHWEKIAVKSKILACGMNTNQFSLWSPPVLHDMPSSISEERGCSLFLSLKSFCSLYLPNSKFYSYGQEKSANLCGLEF